MVRERAVARGSGEVKGAGSEKGQSIGHHTMEHDAFPPHDDLALHVVFATSLEGQSRGVKGW